MNMTISHCIESCESALLFLRMRVYMVGRWVVYLRGSCLFHTTTCLFEMISCRRHSANPTVLGRLLKTAVLIDDHESPETTSNVAPLHFNATFGPMTFFDDIFQGEAFDGRSAEAKYDCSCGTVVVVGRLKFLRYGCWFERYQRSYIPYWRRE